jgi:hypothetical protein
MLRELFGASDGSGTMFAYDGSPSVRDLDWFFPTRAKAMAAAKRLVATMDSTGVPYKISVLDYRTYNAWYQKQPKMKLEVGKSYNISDMVRGVPTAEVVLVADSKPETLAAFTKRVKRLNAKRARAAKKKAA